ncbi:MAG: single-stranded DNA-binding protein [Micrococcaceae bacterium]|nr:single-stranded DNA-binding protein [Micrococcaceae bacterium]
MSTKKIKMGDATVTGNLADEPREVSTREGRTFTAMRILENQRTFDREQQQWVDGDTVGYDVAIQNERLRQHALHGLSKGDRVTVRGNYEVSPYVSQNTGEAGLNHRIGAREVSVSMFDDRFDPSVGVEYDRSPAVENGRTVDHELTAQGGGEMFYEPRPEGTPPPPGPPAAAPTSEFGTPTPAQQREVAQRQQQAAQSWQASGQNAATRPQQPRQAPGGQAEYLAAQQLNELPPRPGASGPTM